MESSSESLLKTKTVALLRESKMEWEGLHSKKWNHPERVHLRANDQLGDQIIGLDPPLLGRKHFAQPYSGTYDYKPCLKLFPDRANRETKLEAFSFKKVAYVPPQRRYNQSDKLRLGSNQSLRGTAGSLPNLMSSKALQDKASQNELVVRPTSKMLSEAGVSATNLNSKRQSKISYGKGSWKDREEREIKYDDEKAVKDLGDWERYFGKPASRDMKNNSRSPQRGNLQQYSKFGKR